MWFPAEQSHRVSAGFLTILKLRHCNLLHKSLYSYFRFSQHFASEYIRHPRCHFSLTRYKSQPKGSLGLPKSLHMSVVSNVTGFSPPPKGIKRSLAINTASETIKFLFGKMKHFPRCLWCINGQVASLTQCMWRGFSCCSFFLSRDVITKLCGRGSTTS